MDQQKASCFPPKADSQVTTNPPQLTIDGGMRGSGVPPRDGRRGQKHVYNDSTAVALGANRARACRSCGSYPGCIAALPTRRIP